jgi:hypothetical protein
LRCSILERPPRFGAALRWSTTRLSRGVESVRPDDEQQIAIL